MPPIKRRQVQTVTVEKREVAGYFCGFRRCLGHLKDVQEAYAGSRLIPPGVSSCSDPTDRPVTRVSLMKGSRLPPSCPPPSTGSTDPSLELQGQMFAQ